MGAAKPDPDRAARPGWSSDTAVTRGQRLVVVVGQPKALAIAVTALTTLREDLIKVGTGIVRATSATSSFSSPR